jgi:hypothetical protein
MEGKEAEHGEGTRQRNCKHGRIGATIYRLSMVHPYHRLACAFSLIYQSAALATRERRQPVADQSRPVRYMLRQPTAVWAPTVLFHG